MNLDLHKSRRPTIAPVAKNIRNGALCSLRMTRFCVSVRVSYGTPMVFPTTTAKYQHVLINNDIPQHHPKVADDPAIFGIRHIDRVQVIVAFAPLRTPVLAAIKGADNCAFAADRPAEVRIEEEYTIQETFHVALLTFPRPSPIGCVDNQPINPNDPPV